jgi:hypothetical protein
MRSSNPQSPPSPRDLAELYITLGQPEALDRLFKERPELAVQRRGKTLLKHLAANKPALLRIIKEAESRIGVISHGLEPS